MNFAQLEDRKNLSMGYIGKGKFCIMGIRVKDVNRIGGLVDVVGNSLVVGWWYLSDVLKSLKVLGYSEASIDDGAYFVLSSNNWLDNDLDRLRRIEEPVEIEICSRFNGNLFEVQKRGVIGLLSRNGVFGLFDDMGLGKTVEAIYAIGLVWEKIGICRCLVICPKSVKFEWRSAFKRFLGTDVSFAEDEMWGDIVIAHFEQLIDREIRKTENGKTVRSRIKSKVMDRLRREEFGIRVIDEAHFIKNVGSKRTKVIRSLISNASEKKVERFICGKIREKELRSCGRLPYTWFLTGTPMEFPDDIYVFLREGFGSGFMNLKEFREFFMNEEEIYVKGGRRIKIMSGVRNGDILASLVSKISLRRDRSEIIEIDKLDRVVKVAFSDDERSKYKEVLSACKNSLEKVVRGIQFINKIKRKVVLDIIRETSDRVVVWTVFRDAVDEVVEFLNKNKIRAVGLKGGDSIEEVKKRFETDARVIVSTVAKGGLGINFMKLATVVIYIEKPFSYAQYIQSRDRVMRVDRDLRKPVLFIDIQVRDSVDRIINEVIEKKTELNKLLLEYSEVVQHLF